MPSPTSSRSAARLARSTRIETDLQFQRAMAPLERRLRHLPRSGRIDSAGVDLDRAAARRRAISTTRSCGAAHRDPTAPDRCPRSPAQTGRARRIAVRAPKLLCVSVSKISDGLGCRTARYRRRQDFVDDPRPMFGARRRKIAPDLAPADDGRPRPRRGRTPPAGSSSARTTSPPASTADSGSKMPGRCGR